MISTDHIAQHIRKVVVIGPECTGKSELTRFLAAHYKTVHVEEYARAYLNKLIRGYESSDLTKIAHGQARMEDEWVYDANQVLICDTNAIVIKIWSEYKYGSCDQDILRIVKERKYDLYLLTYIDIPWENDPQREHPDKRELFWQIFQREIEQTGVPSVVIRGERKERQALAIQAIDNLISAN
jgi:NadR type nicotinamide-nucleotide adenylyltransferase